MDTKLALDHVLTAWRANPFDVSDAQREAAEAALAAVPVSQMFDALLESGDLVRSGKLVLALGHRRACGRPDDPGCVLDEVPARVFARLHRGRHEYVPIAMAAGRCHGALRALHGQSAPMIEVRRQVWAACFGHSLRRALEMERVVRDHNVLLLGETGTGKELVARALLAGAPGQRDGEPAPYASLNAASVPETLVESELFGYVEGAFTGAKQARAGCVRSAHRGCLFLDEVGDLPATTQVKLLRVIESNEVRPVGSDRTETVDVRYIAATHKQLPTQVETGAFRRDLFERLAGCIVRLPPLRERPDDIAPIGEALVARYIGDRNLTSDDDVDRLYSWLHAPTTRSYHWPGNVRELENALRNLMLGLQPHLRVSRPSVDAGADDMPPGVRGGTTPLREVRDWYVSHVVAVCGGNLTVAAQRLGIDRTTVRRQLDARPQGQG